MGAKIHRHLWNSHAHIYAINAAIKYYIPPYCNVPTSTNKKINYLLQQPHYCNIQWLQTVSLFQIKPNQGCLQIIMLISGGNNIDIISTSKARPMHRRKHNFLKDLLSTLVFLFLHRFQNATFMHGCPVYELRIRSHFVFNVGNYLRYKFLFTFGLTILQRRLVCIIINVLFRALHCLAINNRWLFLNVDDELFSAPSLQLLYIFIT